MFDNIKMAIAKAAPRFCYVEEVEPDTDDVFEEDVEDEEESCSVTDIVKDVAKKAKTYATTVAKIFVEVVPVNEETPLDLASQAVDAAFTAAGEAIVIGAATVFTAQYSLPIRVLSGIVASITAAKAAEKWKHDIIHPVVEGYKGKLKTVCAAQHIDPEINMAFETLVRDGATQDECLEAVNTIMDAAYSTDEEQNEVFRMCRGNVGEMVMMASEVIEAKALEENKFYTEFLSKPFVEQKWFVKAKNWFKKMKEPFADPENREVAQKAIRTYAFGVGLTAVAASVAGPAWFTVFFGGIVVTCCIGVSEIVAKMIDMKKESVCNA